MGIAHSFESYLDNKLVGGVYGLRLGRFFVAESGFYREPNASKVAMVALAEYLNSSRIKWFDCQMVTNFSAGFGAREIPRAIFMQMLNEVIDDKSV